MFDASFDDRQSGLSALDRRWLWAIRIVAVVAVGGVLAASADAQLPGLPVLQNAWATPGMVGALDVGGGPDGSVYAAAVSWTPINGHFQVSGGGGFRSRTGVRSAGAYGMRAAVPFGGASSAFGFAAFAGIGGGSGGTTHTVCNVTATATMPPGCAPEPPPGTGFIVDSTASGFEVPVGVGIGWRHAIGVGGHGVAVYATPSYVFFSGGSKTNGVVRASLAADAGITPSLGATLGVELGGSRAKGLGGPSGVLYGLGVSYAFGRR